MKSHVSPFVKVAFSILLGVGSALWFNPIMIIVILGVFCIIFHFYKAFSKFTLYVLILLVSFVLGNISFQHNNLENLNRQTYQWKGIILEKGQQFSKGLRYTVQLISVSNDEKKIKVNGKIMLMAKTEDVFQKGEIIDFKGKCNLITAQDTNFWNHLNYKKGLQAIIWSKQVQKTSEIDVFYFYLGKTQDYLEKQIHRFIQNSESAALAMGILLGDKSYMDKETKNEFINSGAAHILAVSGLHVGILTLFLNFLLGLFFTNRLKYIIIILFLVAYAFITGLSPAVVRAVLMACFALIAKLTERNFSIVNILAFTFSLQLLLDPFLIFHLGFWLSYLAVLGIIFIQPQLVITARNKIWKWLQDNITVGISAQIATLPILLGFLGKFPLLFIFTNLVTLPLSVIATYAGFFLLFVGQIPFINECVGVITDYLFRSVLITNEWIAQIPFSSLEFKPSIIGMSIALIGLIGITYYFYQRKKELSNNSLSFLI